MQLSHSTAALAAQIIGSYSTSVLDVGARWGAGGAWWRIEPLATLIGFDPDAAECTRLNRQSDPRRERYVPAALGRTAGPATFYQTAEPACSSLFKPDERLIGRYPSLNVIRVAQTGQLQLTTLDEWAAAEQPGEISFIKLDTQGSEADILRGGEFALRECLGLEIEVHFSPLYRGAPLFAEVDTYLRAQGYVLWRLNELCHYTEISTRRTQTEDTTHYGDLAVTSPAGSGRLTWANAVYFKDFYDEHLVGDNPRRLLIMASLLDALGDLDSAAGCLRQTLKCHADSISQESRLLISARIDELTQENAPIRIDANISSPDVDDGAQSSSPSDGNLSHRAHSPFPRPHFGKLWHKLGRRRSTRSGDLR